MFFAVLNSFTRKGRRNKNGPLIDHGWGGVRPRFLRIVFLATLYSWSKMVMSKLVNHLGFFLYVTKNLFIRILN